MTITISMIIKIILHSDLLILYFLVLFLDLVTVTLTVSWTEVLHFKFIVGIQSQREQYNQH